MVTSLRSPLKSLLLDTVLGKTQPADSETHQPVSFGELLKLKEKQLQHAQDVSASAVAAALMALQTMTNAMPAPIPDMDTGAETHNTTTQPMTPPRAQVQNTMTVDLKLTGTSTPANAIETTELAPLAGSTNRVIPTETSASVTGTFSNALAANTPQQMPAQPQPSEKSTTSFVTAQVSKPTAQPNIRTQTASPLTDHTGEVVNMAAKNIKPKVDPQQTPSVETSAATSFVNAENKRAIPLRKSQVPTGTEVPTQASSVLTSPLQTEAKGTISQIELPPASQPETSDASPAPYAYAQPEMNQATIQFTSEQVEMPANKVTAETEPSTPISVQPTVAQTDANQKTVQFDIGQTEELPGTAVATVETPDMAPVLPTSAKPIKDQTSSTFSSKQIEKPINILSPKMETPEETPAQYPSERTVKVQRASLFASQSITDSANSSPEKAEVSDEVPVQFLDVQPEIDQKTISFAFKQEDERGNIAAPKKATLPDTPSTQYSTSQSVLDGNTAGNTAQQDVKPSTISSHGNVILNDHEGSPLQTRETHGSQQPSSSNRLDIPRENDKIVSDVKTSGTVIPTTQEWTPEVKLPVSAPTSSPKKIETEPRPVVPQTVTKAEASSMVSVQPADNPVSVQAEVRHDEPSFETKSAEIRTDEMPRQVPMKQVAENLINPAETHKTETPMQIPLADASTSEVVARPQVEKNTSEVSSPVKLTTSQPAMKSPLSQAEIESTELAGEATIEQTTALHPAPKQTSQPVENKGQSGYTKSAQVMPKAIDETTPDVNTYRETRKVASQVEVQMEANITPQIQDAPETMRVTTLKDAETVRFEVEQPKEFNNTSTLENPEVVIPETDVVEKPNSSAKRIVSSDNNTERPVVNSTQPIPDVAPDLVSTNQNKVNKQTIDIDTGLLNPYPNETAQPEIHMQSAHAETETIKKQSVASAQVHDNVQVVDTNVEPSATSIATLSDTDTEKLDKVTTIPAEDMPAATFLQTTSYASSNPVISSRETDTREVKVSRPPASKTRSILDAAQSDADLPAVEEVATNIQTSAGIVKDKTRTIDQAGVEIVFPEEQPAVDVAPSQTFVEPKKVTVKSEMVTPQAGKMAVPVNEPQLAQLVIPAKYVSDEIAKINHQPVVQAETSQATPLQSTSKFTRVQTTVAPKAISSEFEGEAVQVEMPVPTVELQRSNSSATASSAESTQIAKDNNETKTASQATVPFDAPEVQPFEPKAKSIEHRNMETQVNVDVAATALKQNVHKSVDENEVAAVTSTHTADTQNEIPVASVEKFDHPQAVRADKFETVDWEAKPEVLSVEKQEIPVPSQPGVSVKAKPEKEDVETNYVAATEEKLRPVEKQSKLNQTPELTVATTGLGKEAAVESSGKMPIHQANVQATEIVQQVIRQMNVKIKNGPSSMHLQLNPKDLGAIDVEMVSSSQGVHVTFFAEQAGTGKLLESQLTQLRDSLVDSGVQLSGLNISQHHQSGQKGGSFNQENNFARYAEREFTQTDNDHKETARVEPVIGQTGEVDYRI